jgi:hypothetical protein
MGTRGESALPVKLAVRGFGAGKFELGGDILGSEVIAALAGTAAFEGIAREGNHRYPDRLGHDK